MSASASDVALARATVVLVPTRASAAELRCTLEDAWLVDRSSAQRRAVVLPDILTRADWYRRLAAHLPGGRRFLSDVEREVLLAAAAREAIQAGSAPPFRMRPALVAEMIRFYDTLKRQQKSVADFDRLVLEDLEPRAEFDRGAERLLRQTRFLVAAYGAFERRMDQAAAVDEHVLRLSLVDEVGEAGEAARGAPPGFIRRIVLTMGDRVSDPSGGLYPADFDLLTRLPHLESIDVVATRAVVLAGFGERVRNLMPGIEERECEDADPAPSLVTPSAPGRLHFVSRDREDELRDIARRIKRGVRETSGASPRMAVVYRRPLPYVYLARTVFGAAGIETQVSDALPLAAEPFAAALDLIFAAVASRFARRPLIQLLRSPHFRFEVEGSVPAPAETAALDRALAESGYLGDIERLRAFADIAPPAAASAAHVALALAEELAPLSARGRTSSHVACLLSFIRIHERQQIPDQDTLSRHLRARAAVLTILDDMRAAALLHDDPEVEVSEIAARVRRWIESQTFAPARGDAGVRLIDAQSARYGRFDHVHLAGLVAGDWPEPSARNIFYPPFLLARLGWPRETERLAAERAAFMDLTRLAVERVSVSTFTLEDDGIVEHSPLLEDVEQGGFVAVPDREDGFVRVFADEALKASAPVEAALSEGVRGWVALRASRTPAGDAAFHGFTHGNSVWPGPSPSRPYTVTGLDRYLECPFKYFAATILKLGEETPDEQGLSPKERGRFVHEVFRSFFAEWQARGGRDINVGRLDEARDVFAEIAERSLATLPALEAALERLRLLGSVGAPGLGEIAFAAEAERAACVTSRELEFPFEGNFELAAGEDRRVVRLRGKADRVDLLSDGSMRIIDYKIGRSPEKSIQLPIYAVCLAQQFAREGRPTAGAEAFYVAFGDRRNPVQAVIGSGAKSNAVLEDAQRRALEAIDGIQRGEFPPRPAEPRLCGTCPHAAVCRKDYVVAD